MNKETIIRHLNNRGDMTSIIAWYCLEKGKDPNLTKYFITALQSISLLSPNADLLEYCYDYALAYYVSKYNIMLIFNKNGEFIKAL